MSEPTVVRVLRRTLLRTSQGARSTILRTNPAKLLVLGYMLYMVVGFALLSLPAVQSTPVSTMDNLFIAVSAVSTTGLVSVDPASSYSFWGELILLLLIQIGGIGYMTIGSFAVLATQHRLTAVQEKVTKATFSLPDDCRPAQFIRTVILFTLICEFIGAVALYFMFADAGLEDAGWSAIFHTVSAFCTAGFSLYSNSFEAFRGHAGVNIVLSTLSLLGAMGFLIIWDMWRNLTSRAFHLGFTSKVIIRMTSIFLLVGTTVLFVVEPSLTALPPSERLLAAFFQTMTASTTVGFNTHPIGALGYASLMILFFLMAIGASPSGTGGGLKTTTFAAMLGLLRSTLKQRGNVRFFKRTIPPARLQSAGASFMYFVVLLFIALFLLVLTEAGVSLEVLVFEAISALGTVGLSMGVTGELSPLGKLIIIVLMTAGRVGVLTFGIAFAMHDESEDEEQDNELLL